MNNLNKFHITISEDYGYMGLYAGLKAKDIHTRKGLKPTQNILDFMGYTELATNWFRITQTEEKLSREGIKGKDEAQQIYLKVGERVRHAIKKLGGIMPEDLPTQQIHPIK
jgi:DNA-damage-inducible protein D